MLRDADGARAVIIATGSEVAIALDAQAQLAKDGIAVRVVSMPSTDVFDKQDAAWKQSVLPKGLPRVAVEAGVTAFCTWAWKAPWSASTATANPPGRRADRAAAVAPEPAFVQRDAATVAAIARGGYVLRDADGARAVIIATGSVAIALDAQAQAKDGIAVRVVSMPSTDVFDKGRRLEAVRAAQGLRAWPSRPA